MVVVIEVMSRVRTPVLHFDGEPGKTSLVVVPLPVPEHSWFEPGCRHVVANGSFSFSPGVAGHWVVTCADTNSGLWTVLNGPVMSPHTSGAASRLMKLPAGVLPA